MNKAKVRPGEILTQEEIKSAILKGIQELLKLQNISKIYFIDDAINQDTGKETFKVIIQNIIKSDKLSELKVIEGGIDFNKEEVVLYDHIDEIWDNLDANKQLDYFENAHTVDGKPEAIRDLNVSSALKTFFDDGQIVFLTPNEWDEKHQAIIDAVNGQSRIMIIFDQVLKLAPGRFSEQNVQGEQLIAELKQKVGAKSVMALLTHTVTDYEREIPERTEICERINTLIPSDFFVLAKARLSQPVMFADGIKKVLINGHIEAIKENTVNIIKKSYEKAVKKIEDFDTYDFDATILKTSLKDGIWEPQTIIRIANIVFENELKKLMVETDYVLKVNPELKASQNYNSIKFPNDNAAKPYPNKQVLRHQEIYDSGSSINSLRKPLENGDIFLIGDSSYILVAQACDMAVRKKGDRIGLRTAKVATLLKINTIKEEDLKKKIKESDHYFRNKYLLNYFNTQTVEKAIVDFTEYLIVDIDFLDLCVFNAQGECKINPNRLENKTYLSSIWESRYDILVAKINEYIEKIAVIRKYFHSKSNSKKFKLLTRNFPLAHNPMDGRLNPVLIEKEFYPSLILASSQPVGNSITVEKDWTFSFSAKRIAKYKDYGATYLLERYTRHLSRIAEPHDFAE